MRTVNLLVMAALVAACSAEDGATHDGHTDGETTGQHDIYSDGLMKMTDTLMVSFDSADPAPPTKGKNTFTLKVQRHDGTAVDDGIVTLRPWMVAHKHGVSEGTLSTTAQGSDGLYDVPGVDLFMPGVWELTVSVTLTDGTQESVVFNFMLEG